MSTDITEIRRLSILESAANLSKRAGSSYLTIKRKEIMENIEPARMSEGNMCRLFKSIRKMRTKLVQHSIRQYKNGDNSYNKIIAQAIVFNDNSVTRLEKSELEEILRSLIEN